ncbi:MAG: hypothetical protein ACI9GW_003631 [Halieaceae bacterium]|jgi:hypothetical protein
MFGILKKSIISWLQHKSPAPEYPLSDFERIRHEIKPCDIILVEGRSRVSNVIKLVTQSPWSHAALYIGKIHDIESLSLREELCRHFSGSAELQLIVESELGVGVVVRPLSEYEEEHVRLCRPRGLAHGDSQLVLHYAISQLGLAYNVRQTFDLARLMFPWMILPRRWRSTLFKKHAGDSTETICSTMIAEAFGSIQFPILPLVKRNEDNSLQMYRRNPRLCTPSDFDYSPYFDIIKYPFVDFSEHANHRLLPWNGGGRLAGEEASHYLSPGAEDEEEESVSEAPKRHINSDSEAAPRDLLKDVEIDSQIL